jgi:hypothetical protein
MLTDRQIVVTAYRILRDWVSDRGQWDDNPIGAALDKDWPDTEPDDTTARDEINAVRQHIGRISADLLNRLEDRASGEGINLKEVP